MKKVLLATTAAAALSISGAAFADGHITENFGFSGTTSFGYNDDIEGGIFMDTDLTLSASREVGDYEVGGAFEFDVDWNEGDTTINSTSTAVGGEVTTGFAFDNVFVDTPVGKLTFNESNDGASASDLFYNDRDGMADDVQNLDGFASLLWEGNVGQFDYAIDTGNIDNGSNDDWSLGVGTSFAAGGTDIDLGFGYDNDSTQGNGIVSGNSAWGISADFGLSIFDVGLSYIDGASESSFGVAANVDITPELNVGAYYAANSSTSDGFGITVDYATGPFALAFDYDTGNGDPDNFEVDVSYNTGTGAIIYAGYDENDDAFYVGTEVDVADGIVATLAYSEADEVGGPEFKDGFSAFMTVSY